MAPCYTQMSLSERRSLYRLLAIRCSIAEIARQLGRHRSTIYREIRRNFHHDADREFAGYFPVTAQEKTRDRRRRQRKLLLHPALRQHLVQHLHLGWSPRHSSQAIGTIGAALNAWPCSARRSITFDRGTEFLRYEALSRTLPEGGFFCDPHNPWQKGSVENANGRLRRYLPRDTAIGDLAPAELNQLAAHLNGTPCKCLGYRTPSEAFHSALAFSQNAS